MHSYFTPPPPSNKKTIVKEMVPKNLYHNYTLINSFSSKMSFLMKICVGGLLLLKE